MPRLTVKEKELIAVGTAGTEFRGQYTYFHIRKYGARP